MTLISNKALLDKCREFIVADPSSQAVDRLIKDALVTANREIFTIDGSTPLAWARESYDELFTRANAEISAVTAANPGVITADSVDTDLSSDHGFQDDDVVYIDGIDGMDRLNRRTYLGTRASATTLTLTQLDGTNVIDTSGYDAYSAGGKVCHVGFVLPKASIEPTAAQISTESYRWTIKRVWDVTFDGHPARPISEEKARDMSLLDHAGGRPKFWRYQKYYRGGPDSLSHLLLWYGWPSAKYNVSVHIEKQYPDLSEWAGAVYPPHPEEIHDCIWHRALKNLATNAERQRRESTEGRLMGQIEVLYAQVWTQKAAEDEAMIKRLSRNMLGEMPHYGGTRA
jgi:hypothetical protein